jgi:hypothetical protein
MWSVNETALGLSLFIKYWVHYIYIYIYIYIYTHTYDTHFSKCMFYLECIFLFLSFILIFSVVPCLILSFSYPLLSFIVCFFLVFSLHVSLLFPEPFYCLSNFCLSLFLFFFLCCSCKTSSGHNSIRSPFLSTSTSTIYGGEYEHCSH